MSRIWNCEPRFEFKCPKFWQELRETDSTNVRHCDSCNEDVTFCETPEQFVKLGNAGHCVAINSDLDSNILSGISQVMGRPSPESWMENERRQQEQKAIYLEWWNQAGELGPTFESERFGLVHEEVEQHVIREAERNLNIGAEMNRLASEFEEASFEDKNVAVLRSAELYERAQRELPEIPSGFLHLWQLALRDSEYEVRLAAANTLYSRNPREAKELIRELRKLEAEAPNSEDATIVRKVLARAGDPEALQWVAQELRNPNLEIRESVASDLYAIDSKLLCEFPELTEALDDDSKSVQVAVAAVLWHGRQDYHETVPVLVKIIENESSDGRLADADADLRARAHNLKAARLLIQMGEHANAAWPSLLKLKSSDDRDLRASSVAAIVQMKLPHEETHRLLTELTADPDYLVRLLARRSLDEKVSEQD